MDGYITLLILITALLATVVVISGLIFHKIRRVHIATFTLAEGVSETHKETLALFGQIQALMALERRLDLPMALPPMRGWAASPDVLLVVAEKVLERKPKTVMECSSGTSTVVIARCLQLNGSGHVFSLEHDPHYAEKTRALISRYGLTEWATVIDAPLTTLQASSPWYSEENIPSDLSSIDILVVDGPPATTAALARLPALPRLKKHMSDDCIIIVDDADRPDEQMILKKWMQEMPEAQMEMLACEKGCALIRTKK